MQTKLAQMAETTINMVTGSVDAYVKQDLELVKEVIAMDDKVDELFLEVRDEIAGLLKSDAVARLDCMDMLMIAKYYERIGDHATNIAEWVEFSITGMHKDSGRFMIYCVEDEKEYQGTGVVCSLRQRI